MKKIALAIVLCTLILESCSNNEEICRKDFTLVSYIPSYTYCDWENVYFEFSYDTTYNELRDNCECKVQLELLQIKWEEMKNNQPTEELFMWEEAPLIHKCIETEKLNN